MYFLSGFAILVGLGLKPLGLGAEFNSASDGVNLEGVYRSKKTFIIEILIFRVNFEVFPIRIRYTTWVMSQTTWVR
jgi:hypothetical protein